MLLELELVLEGEEVWTPLPTPPEEGEDGRESCLFLTLRLKMGNLETRVERRGPDSPIRDKHQRCQSDQMKARSVYTDVFNQLK